MERYHSNIHLCNPYSLSNKIIQYEHPLHQLFWRFSGETVNSSSLFHRDRDCEMLVEWLPSES